MQVFSTICVVANWFILVFGDEKNATGCTKDNPVPALERYFARSLYQRVSLESGGGNLLVSPLGVDILLATLLVGAHGTDRERLAAVLGLSQLHNFPDTNWKHCYLQLLGNITSFMQVSTRIYIDKGFVVNKDFQKIANDYYFTGVEVLDLTNKGEAAEAINTFVKANTNNTIRQIITGESLSASSSMVCVSTLHLRDQWAVLFPKQVTSEQPFHSSHNTSSLVSMMHVRKQFRFVWDATFRAKLLALDFITKKVSMILILPDKEDELFDLEATLMTLDCIPLFRLLRSVPPVHVDLLLPRFTLQEDLDLRDTLQQMGLTGLFSSSADLSGISCCDGLHVSTIKQKSHLVVGESGVEASSTDVVENSNEAEEESWQEFHADHPFLFYLITDELVVTQGRVIQP